MPRDPVISTVKASVELDDGRIADITLVLDRSGKPAADATVDHPDGYVREVENIAVGLPHLKAALRLPFYDALERAQGTK